MSVRFPGSAGIPLLRKKAATLSQLPVPVWLPEVGIDVSSDPVFVGYNVSPKRINGLLTVGRQLLIQQVGPELDRILIGDLSRQPASRLDQVALYGGGPAANQPTGLINVAGSTKALRSIRRNCTPRFVRSKS